MARWRKAGVLISVLLLHWPVEGLAQGDKVRTFSEAWGCRFEGDLGKIQTYMRQNDRKALEAAWQELTMNDLCRELPDVEAFVMDYRGAGAWQIRMPGDRAEWWVPKYMLALPGSVEGEFLGPRSFLKSSTDTKPSPAAKDCDWGMYWNRMQRRCVKIGE